MWGNRFAAGLWDCWSFQKSKVPLSCIFSMQLCKFFQHFQGSHRVVAFWTHHLTNVEEQSEPMESRPCRPGAALCSCVDMSNFPWTPPFHLHRSCLFRSRFTSVAEAGPLGPEVWFLAGSDAVRASGESRQRAPSAHCPSHTNARLISSDTMPIPQWAVPSALFIDLAVECWSARGSCVRQHATGRLTSLYSVYF